MKTEKRKQNKKPLGRIYTYQAKKSSQILFATLKKTLQTLNVPRYSEL